MENNYVLEVINADRHLGYVKEAWEHPQTVLFEITGNEYAAKWYNFQEARDLAMKNNSTCIYPADEIFILRKIKPAQK